MTKRDLNPKWSMFQSETIPYFLLPLGLALAGQAFLIQREQPWTLFPGLLLYSAAIFFFLRSGALGPSRPRTSVPREGLWAGLAFLLAVFFRTYHLTQVPPGITLEEACGPWLGYAVPRDQWAKYYLGALSMTCADVPAAARVFFHLFEPSHLSYSLFYVLFALAAFPLGYYLFRDIAGPRAALLTLFFWAVMQWHVTLSRSGHAAVTASFYAILALAIFRWAWKKDRVWAWTLAGVGCSFGFYAYPAYRACVLLLPVLYFFETFQAGAGGSRRLRVLIPFLAAFVISAWPCLKPMWDQGNWMTGSQKDQDFIGHKIAAQGSLRPLLDNLVQASLMFNRQGSSDPQENFPDHRLVDDITGPLMVLGFFLCLRRWRERDSFYALSGFVILSLPAVLTYNPLRDSRIMVAAPFAAFLAALAAQEIWERTLNSPGLRRTGSRRIVLGAAVLAGIFLVGENYKVYFMDRPGNEACWAQANMSNSRTGQAMADLGPACEYLLAPAFWGSFNVLFLGHSQLDHAHRLDIPEDLGPLPVPSGRDLFFSLEEGRTGVLNLLHRVYPGGRIEKCLDPWGHPYVYFFRVPAQQVGSNQGLKDGQGNVRSFPPEQGPGKMSLSGGLWVPWTGNYRYRTRGTFSSAGLCPWKGVGPVRLIRGFQPLEFNYRSLGGKAPVLEESFEGGPFTPVGPGRFMPLDLGGTWVGTYRSVEDPKHPTLLVERDPVLNFTHREDFPLNLPGFSVVWEGTLRADREGDYAFLMTATDHSRAELEIDGKTVAVIGQETVLHLPRKDHPITVRYRQDGGVLSAFHLVWRPPGQSAYSILPPEAMK